METTYWQSAADDEAMQDEHLFIWRAMLETIDVDHSGTRVLDAGCNRGGFLRLLADQHDKSRLDHYHACQSYESARDRNAERK